MAEFLIATLPLLLLLVFLLLGRYPGHEAAMRLVARIAASASAVTTSTSNWRRPKRPISHVVGGGLLLAFGLSGRAPPA
jgi:hypothetical protein